MKKIILITSLFIFTFSLAAPSSRTKTKIKTTSKMNLETWKEDYAYRVVGNICHPDSLFSHCSTLNIQNCVYEVKKTTDQCLSLTTRFLGAKKTIKWEERKKTTSLVGKCLNSKIKKFKDKDSTKCQAYIQKIRNKQL